MAPLSKDTAGIILPFDTFGSHLDQSNKTIDTDLEIKNFEAAGKILASVWNESIIDSHPVIAEYQTPNEAKIGIDYELDQNWIDDHISKSRYLLQIVKCKNKECCQQTKTNYEDTWFSIFTSTDPS